MKICIVYTSPKLGDIILQLPFVHRISKFFNTKVTYCINKHGNIKKILEKQDYIEEIIENGFRRQNFFSDHVNFIKDLRKRKFDKIFILEKTKGPLLSAVFSNIKERYAFGIGIEKIFLKNKQNTLNKNDLRYNYTEQSLRFLNKIGIDQIQFDTPFLKNLNENKYIIKLINKFKKPWVSFGIDSNEINRKWPMKNFAELADRLIDNNLASHIFIINQKRDVEGLDYFEEMKNFSKHQDKLFDCKIFNRNQIIDLIYSTAYFVGIDSGPSCIAGAIGKKTFCIFGPTDVTLPKFSSMNKIISDMYNPDREIGIKRCGDNFDQTDKEVRTISVDKVYNNIFNNLVSSKKL